MTAGGVPGHDRGFCRRSGAGGADDDAIAASKPFAAQFLDIAGVWARGGWPQAPKYSVTRALQGNVNCSRDAEAHDIRIVTVDWGPPCSSHS
jgi:hypothetical protein